MKRNFVLLALCGLFFAACSKKADSGPATRDSVSTTTPLTTDIYVVGIYADLTAHTGGVAAYWKNDSLVLEGGYNISNGVAIAVSGSDVYVAGTAINSASDAVIGYWKNGTMVSLPVTLQSEAPTGIAVNGQDVYVAGSGINSLGNSVVGYWKNGVFTQLTPDTVNAFCQGIAVSGNDVYVAGFQFSTGMVSATANYWKNGVAVNLPNFGSATANCITVSGMDVYVSGSAEDVSGLHDKAQYWKNGVPVILSDSSGVDYATSILVSGPDVYVTAELQTGTIVNTTGYIVGGFWKNGVLTKLSDGSADCHVTGVAANGSDVYVSYYSLQSNGFFGAFYFKDNQSVQLSDPHAAGSASGVVTVTH